MPQKLIATILKDERVRAGLSKMELAKRTGLGKTTIFDIEANKYTPSLGVLEKICRALGMSLPITVEGVLAIPNGSFNLCVDGEPKARIKYLTNSMGYAFQLEKIIKDGIPLEMNLSIVAGGIVMRKVKLNDNSDLHLRWNEQEKEWEIDPSRSLN